MQKDKQMAKKMSLLQAYHFKRDLTHIVFTICHQTDTLQILQCLPFKLEVHWQKEYATHAKKKAINILVPPKMIQHAKIYINTYLLHAREKQT